MHHHPRGLVDDEHVVVFVRYVQWDGFGVYRSPLRRRNLHSDVLTGAEPVAGFLTATVHHDASVGDQCRRLIPGQVECFGNGDVETTPVARGRE